MYVATDRSDANLGTDPSSHHGYAFMRLPKINCPSTTISIAAGTYNEDLLDLTIDHEGVSIVGAGMGNTIFQQSGSGDHFMEIKNGATDITISNYDGKGGYDENNDGGAIDIISGAISFYDVHFDNNKTTSIYDDGGCCICFI